MVLSLVGIAAGLVILTVAAEHFVRGAARTSAALRISPVVIGAVVIGFGTSAPEMVVSGLAANRGQLDIAVGNVIGSNVANLSLVLGTAALFASITVASTTLRREAPLSLGAVLLYALLVQGGLSRLEGAVLAGALVVILGVLLTGATGEGDDELTAEVDEYLADHRTSTSGELVRTGLGLVGTLAAAQLLVVAATDAAAELGLGEGFVGLTIVAIGTSLPELATSVQAARKGETDLIVGNLLGSNIFNSLAVAGIAAVVGPGRVVDRGLESVGVSMMVAISVLATLFMASGRRVTRVEGMALLLVYGAMVLLVL